MPTGILAEDVKTSQGRWSRDVKGTGIHPFFSQHQLKLLGSYKIHRNLFCRCCSFDTQFKTSLFNEKMHSPPLFLHPMKNISDNSKPIENNVSNGLHNIASPIVNQKHVCGNHMIFLRSKRRVLYKRVLLV